MQPERAERLAELVEHAFELEGAQRAAFLAQACGDDLELRAEVEALLHEEERAAKLNVRAGRRVWSGAIARRSYDRRAEYRRNAG